MVEGDDQVQCLSKGQNVTLTCDIYGFPRLGIVFRRDLMLIPGGENFERITKISSDQVSCLAIACRKWSGTSLIRTSIQIGPKIGLILAWSESHCRHGSTPHKDPWESD